MLHGLVLCGGKSSRMGTDKGLLQKGGQTWARITAEKIGDLAIPVFVSINSTQQNAYSALFSPEAIILDTLPLHGPLAGLLAAHSQHPQSDWLVCACDMPDLTQEVLQQLQQVYEQLPEYDCWVFQNKGEWEPLCGIYSARVLQKIMRIHQVDSLVRHSMKFVLEICQTYALTSGETTESAFKNYNLPGDVMG